MSTTVAEYGAVLVATVSDDPATRETAYGCWLNRIVKHIGSVELGALTSADLDRMYADMARGGPVSGRVYSPSTIRQTHLYLAQMYNRARETAPDLIKPTDKAHPPKASAARDVEQQRPALGPAQAAAFARFMSETYADTLYGAVETLCAHTGIRRSEALGIQWGDIEGAIVTICRKRGTAGSGDYTGDTKNRKPREIPLNSSALAAIAVARKHAADDGRPTTSKAYVFAHPDGTPFSPRALSKWMRRRREEYNTRHPEEPLPDGFGLQSLRHTFATLLIRTPGVSTKTVSEILGHSNVAFTMRQYVLSDIEQMAEAATTLEGILRGLLETRGSSCWVGWR
jgi:integrase